jgi:hypothetical protein
METLSDQAGTGQRGARVCTMIVPQESIKGKFSGTVNILGNGPGLKKARIDELAPCLGMNESWRIRPALIHCFVDVNQLSNMLTGLWHKSRYIVMPPQFESRIHEDWYRNFPAQDHIFYAHTAGFAGLYAINLAKYAGFNKLLLHGYDGTNHLGNFYEDKPAQRIEAQYPCYKWEANQAKKDRVEIINMTPHSDIPYFKKG